MGLLAGYLLRGKTNALTNLENRIDIQSKAKTDRLNELNALLNVDKRENEIVGGEPDEGDKPPEKKPRDLER